MCGRYTLSAEPDAIQQEFNLSELPKWEPRFNIAPSQPVPIITGDDPDTLSFVTWGLVPSWADSPNIGYKMINARSETVAEKPSFRAAFKRRRCLIPTTGFYEWQKVDGSKQPYFIHLDDKDVFSFAGLWEQWHGDDGSQVWSCTIITTNANEKIKHLHHRMPVILDGDAREAWLDTTAEKGELLHILQPFDEERMAYYPVSREVNSPKNDHPALIERDDPPNQQSMF